MQEDHVFKLNGHIQRNQMYPVKTYQSISYERENNLIVLRLCNYCKNSEDTVIKNMTPFLQRHSYKALSLFLLRTLRRSTEHVTRLDLT